MNTKKYRISKIADRYRDKNTRQIVPIVDAFGREIVIINLVGAKVIDGRSAAIIMTKVAFETALISSQLEYSQGTLRGLKGGIIETEAEFSEKGSWYKVDEFSGLVTNGARVDTKVKDDKGKLKTLKEGQKAKIGWMAERNNSGFTRTGLNTCFEVNEKFEQKSMNSEAYAKEMIKFEALIDTAQQVASQVAESVVTEPDEATIPAED